MANLTTASQVSEFRQDLSGEQYHRFFRMIPRLASMHKERYDPMRSGGWARGRAEIPDENSLFTSFSTVMIILFKLVDDMETTEDILDGLIDDQDDEEQIMHSQGELFALKTTYLSITGMIESIEINRVDMTAMGTAPSPKTYFTEVLRSGGLPTDRPADELIPSKYGLMNMRTSNPFINSNTISFNPPKIPAI